MKFNERQEFIYDTELFTRADTQTALKLHDEYIRRHSCKPAPVFFEVDVTGAQVDQLWHMPTTPRTQFSREMQIPALNMFEKPDWRLTALGISPQRRDKFWVSNISLREVFNYFPRRGDMVAWNGYRYMVMAATVDPSSYWQQTNVWLGMVIECAVVPEGDAKPLADVYKLAEAEKSATIRAELDRVPQRPKVQGR